MNGLKDFYTTAYGTNSPLFPITLGVPIAVTTSTARTLTQAFSVSIIYGAVSIEDLPSGTHELKQPVDAKISYSGSEYIAEFAEAEIVTSGDTPEDAIQWLKETIVSLYDFYQNNRAVLGPLPKLQLSVLEAYVDQK